MKRHGFLLAIAAGAALAVSAAAEAQITSAQQSALRSNCRSDFMSHCSGVTPGGKDALICLQKNVDKLSAGCQTAVRATLPPPAPPPAAAAKPEPAPQATTAAPPPAPPPPAVAAPAPAVAPPPPAPPAAAVAAPPPAAPPPAAPPKARVTAPPPPAVKPAPAAAAAPTPAQQSQMRAACRNDFMSHCAGVQPGGRDALVCLQRNVSALSAACRSVVAATMRAPAPAAAVAAPPPAAAPAAAGPDPAKLKALKFTCRGDFRRLCRNVPQGPEAFACLQAHSAQLSTNCRTSVADLAESMPAGAAMPAPVPTAVKPAPAPHPPKAPVVDAAVVLRACKLDLIRHCRGVGVGGGKIMACLAAHEADLGFRCRTAMKVTKPLH
jgi:hypothetical protein